jgi:hypothetical protein
MTALKDQEKNSTCSRSAFRTLLNKLLIVGKMRFVNRLIFLFFNDSIPADQWSFP